MISTSLHIFGYAYLLTGDPAWLTKGDDQLAAVYGTVGETGADTFRGNADDYTAYNSRHSKNYNEANRWGGTYIALRVGGGVRHRRGRGGLRLHGGARMQE